MGNPKFQKVGKSVQAGITTSFVEIAEEIGKYKLCSATGMAFETLSLRLADPGTYRVMELARLSDLLEIDHKILLEMADRLRKKKSKKAI